MDVLRQTIRVEVETTMRPVQREEREFVLRLKMDEPGALRLRAHLAGSRKEAWFSRQILSLLDEELGFA